MNNRFRFISLSRALPALALSAIVVAPLAPAFAKPKTDSSEGYSKKDKSSKSGKYRGNKNSDRYDGPVYDNGSVYNGSNSNDPVEVPNDNGYGGYNTDPDSRNGRERERRVVEGVVRSEVNGNRFTLRSDGGQVMIVRVRSGAPARLSNGDRVRVEGFERAGRGGNFLADRVQILQNSNSNAYDWDNGGTADYGYGDNSNRRVSFPATVLDRDSQRRLRVRGDNGRTYTVESRYDLVRVDDGDRVRVEGISRAGIVTNARVVLLQNNDASYNGGYGNGAGYGYADQGEFLGRVTKIDRDDDTISVRDDRTRRTYIFRPRQAEDFRIGQRVRATIGVRDGRVALTRVTRL